jgi:RNA polymerase sigma-70 factor (ECF subfamily)
MTVALPLIVQDTPIARMADLVERIQSGDSTAEDAVTRVYNKPIFVMVLARTHDREAALDLTQDVLVAVLEAVRNGQVREPERLAAFVYGIARNLVNNYFRSRTSQPSTDPLSDDLPVAAITDDPGAFEQMDFVRRILERTDPVDRKILLMMLVDGYRADEVAAQLNLSSEVIRQRKCRALKKIMERAKKMSRK